MTSLVTGGCGFVGRHLVKRLLSRGDKVWIVDDLSTGRSPTAWLTADKQAQIEFIHDNAITFFASQLELGTAQRTVDLPAFDQVFHLASVVGGRAVIEGDPMAVAIDLAIDATFFRWAVANRTTIGKILYASSSAVYPVDLQSKTGVVALQESMVNFSDRIGMPDLTYGWSKLTGEYLSQFAVRQYGLAVACVRPFSGYGGDQDQSYPIPAIAARAARREDPLVVWGTGEQGRDFVHIDDCIEALLRAIEAINDGRGVNIGTGQLTTFNQVAALFAQLVDYAPTITPLINKPEGVQSRYSDPTKMRKLLHWQPTISLEQGLQRVLQEQAQVRVSV